MTDLPPPAAAATAPRRLYIFLDEGGNFDFSRRGSRFYSFSCVTMERDFAIYPDLDRYKYEVIEFGKDIDHFHCAEDNPHVRGRVFGIIQSHLNTLKIDNIIVRKCKTGTALQDPAKFYAYMLGQLIRYVLNWYQLALIDEVIIITDNLPLSKKRTAFQKAIKLKFGEMLPAGATYKILHHYSRSHYGLQVADYCNWAILRKWETGDDSHYRAIRAAIRSQFDIFSLGTRKYYDDGFPV